MLIVDPSVLYTLRVLGTFVLDYDRFDQRRKFTYMQHMRAGKTHCQYIRLYLLQFIFGSLKSYIVLVLRKAILTLVRLNKLVILRNNGLQYVDIFPVSEFCVVLLSRPGLFNICCNCEFILWISIRRKLLAFAMCCNVIHSFCFHASGNGSECMRVM